MKERIPKVAQMRLVYRNPQPPEERVRITSSFVAVETLRRFFPDDQMDCKEFVRVLLLNHASDVLGCVPVAEGGRTKVTVDVAAVMQSALLANASGIILAHNHPSGKASPSMVDRALTKQLKEACVIMGITFFDHIILTRDRHYSFADEGQIFPISNEMDILTGDRIHP